MVDIVITGPDSVGELRALQTWLAGEDELRGRARLVAASPPQPGALGPAAESLAVALGPGASAALATGIVAWLRQRTSDVMLKASVRGDKHVELSARRVRSMNSAQVRELVLLLTRELGEPGAEASQSGDEPGQTGAVGRDAAAQDPGSHEPPR